MVGYNFETLNIGYGESKTFELKDGINGGYDNVFVDISSTCLGYNYTNTGKANFIEGGNITIQMNDCAVPSCECVHLEQFG